MAESEKERQRYLERDWRSDWESRGDLAGFVRSDREIALTGRGSGTAFPMMPAVLPRRRSPALQQHRIRTRTRTFPTAARPLRIIMWPRVSHICSLSAARLVLVEPRAPRDHAARGGSARLGLWLAAMPPLRARARSLTSRGRPCVRARARAHTPRARAVAHRARARHVIRAICAPDAWMFLVFSLVLRNFHILLDRTGNLILFKDCIGNKCQARVCRAR